MFGKYNKKKEHYYSSSPTFKKCDLCNMLEDETRLEFYGISCKNKPLWACQQCRLARWGYD